MSKRTFHVLCWVSIGALVALALALLESFPDPMPTHWNAAGQVDGRLPRARGILMITAIPAATYALLALLPRLSPRGFETERFGDSYRIVSAASVILLSALGMVAFLMAAGRLASLTSIYVLVGALLIVIGNYMPKFRRNFWLGVRTPWTLVNEEVWARTHRLGAKLFVVAGLVVMLAPLFAKPALLVLFAAVCAAVVPVVYSYVEYRRTVVRR